MKTSISLTIVTPVQVSVLRRMLEISEYDSNEAQFLIDGFENGFSLGYEGPTDRQDMSNNIPFTIGNNIDMWNKIMKEVKTGRYAGPFTGHIPFENYVQSPIGLVPKSGNKTRLIFHLSYNFKNGNKSVNYWTPEKYCTVKYNDLDHAMRSCLRISQGSDKPSPIALAKSDLASAFRVLPISPKYWKFLILKATNPKNNEVSFFIDKNLPFGSSVSCSHFQRWSNALRHFCEKASGRTGHITNYLDDFLFMETAYDNCNRLVRCFLNICGELKVPVSMEKTEWASDCLVFLGFLLDGKHLMLSIPIEKKTKALNLVNSFIYKKRATVKEIQRLSGFLNFLNKAVVPGRAFTRRMYAIYSNCLDEQGKIKPTSKLKPYHHINLTTEFRNDCTVWQQFLLTPSALHRPFADLDMSQSSVTLNFYSDASANPKLGFGCIFGNHWTFHVWEEDFVRRVKPSIDYLELYAICIGIFTWADKLTNMRIVVFSDNETAETVANKYSSSCKNSMYLLRLLSINNFIHNRRVHVKHVRGIDNTLSDALSRQNFKTFFNEAPDTIDKYPTELPSQIWPMSRIWQF